MSTNKSTNGFRERLDLVLCGRPCTPFLQGIGILGGTANRICGGALPKAEALARIAKVENASITWLLTGQGDPFVVAHPQNREQAIELLETLCGDEDWEVSGVLCQDVRRPPICVLTMPATIQGPDEREPIHYTEMVVLKMPDSASSSLMCVARLAPETYGVRDDAWQDIAGGYAGTYRVLEILRGAKLLSQLVEPPTSIYDATELGDSLRDQIAQLSERDQRLLQALISEMNKED